MRCLERLIRKFDDLLNASYHQDGQKLLATNRYLQKRFDNPKVESANAQQFDNLDSLDNKETTVKVIKNPSSESPKAEDIKL